MVQIMVDKYIFTYNLEGLKFMAAIYILVVLVNITLQYFFIYNTNLLGQSVIKDLRVKVFNHITSLKLTYFDKTAIGTSTTRTINDIETINTVFSQGLITMIADLLGVFAVLGIMIYTSWQLTLICLTTLPFLVIATYIFKEKVKASFQRVRTQISKMNAFLQERITGMRVVQIFNAQQQEMEKFKTINKSYTQANLNSILYYAIFFPVVEIISAASLALMVWWGAKGYLEGKVTFGALVAFPMYLSMLFRPIRLLADKFNTLQMGLVASDRVFTVLDNTEILKDYGTIKTKSIKGEVEFEDVSFAYDGKNFVLENINFKVNPGETLAIIGSTGSGKTTIINILNRFYDIQKGKILIDNKDIKSYDLKDIRSKIAIVLQDVFLFTGTVMQNITLMDPNIEEKEIIEAAKKIGAHDFIIKLPDGYDFVVMERGDNLSMGQRQLISFVRALVQNPDILILDEATSSIDIETEGIIQNAIEKLVDKRTSFIIAHRLSTIRHATNIMVLDKGKIIEFGSHNELMKIKDGHYREMYDVQFFELGLIP
jgi:ATP-binding cassette subfamily B protein